jgi:hypothetical protein
MDRSEGKSGLDLWVGFVANLPWVKGQLDASSYHAFLRAASCGVDAGRAFQEVMNRLSAAGATMNGVQERKCRQQMERAFAFVGGAGDRRQDVRWRPTGAAKRRLQRSDGGEAPPRCRRQLRRRRRSRLRLLPLLLLLQLQLPLREQGPRPPPQGPLPRPPGWGRCAAAQAILRALEYKPIIKGIGGRVAPPY